MNNSTSNQVPLLNVENLTREFISSESGEPLRVLRGLSLEVVRGESIAIVGSSGCGKSTLVNFLLRFYDPDKGKIFIGDHEIRDYHLQDLRKRMKREQMYFERYAGTVKYGENPDVQSLLKMRPLILHVRRCTRRHTQTRQRADGCICVRWRRIFRRPLNVRDP